MISALPLSEHGAFPLYDNFVRLFHTAEYHGIASSYLMPKV